MRDGERKEGWWVPFLTVSSHNMLLLWSLVMEVANMVRHRKERVRGRSSLLSSLRSRLRHSTPGPFVFRLRSPSRSAASRLLPAARNERRRGSVGKETAWVTVRGEETWHRLTLDLWLAKDNRFLNPKSSYKRILMAPSCRFIFCTVSSHMIRSLYSLVPR